MKKFLSIVAAAFVGFFGLANAADFAVDASHSSVNFEVKHLMVSKTKGNFGKFSGVVGVDGKKLTALSGEVDIASINTADAGRDKHLNAPDFFDSAKFPKGALKLVSVKGDKASAELTLRGVTKKIELEYELSGPAKHPRNGKDLVGLSLKGELNRKDFGIGTGTPDAVVSDKVKIAIEIEALK